MTLALLCSQALARYRALCLCAVIVASGAAHVRPGMFVQEELATWLMVLLLAKSGGWGRRVRALDPF